MSKTTTDYLPFNTKYICTVFDQNKFQVPKNIKRNIQ